MNAGRMEQIGTPDEVYHRPATTFVAGFIGSPPMNLLRGQRRRRALHGRRPAAAAAGAGAARRRAGAGRAPRARRARRDRQRGWPLRVQALEMLGAERLVYGRLGETLFTVRLDATLPHPKVGDIVVAAWPRPSTCTGSTRRPRRASAPDGDVTTAPWPYPRWIAHRGAGKLAPENTLAAFRLGAAHGYRAFECDVKLSRRRRAVPAARRDAGAHDRRAAAPPATLPWSELSRLDAGGWHSRAYAGEPLPSFDAIARFCLRNGFALNIEIKPTPGGERETGRVVAREAARCGRRRRCRRCSARSSPTRSQARATAAPQLPRALLLDTLRAGWLDEARALGCVAVVTHYALHRCRACSPPCTAPACAACVYTVNDPAEARRLDALGIDGIITDAVDRFSPGSGVAD